MKYILKIKWEILIVLQLLQNLPNINNGRIGKKKNTYLTYHSLVSVINI